MENVFGQFNSLPRNQLPRLSVQERESRWTAIRKKMRDEQIDCLLIHGDSGKWDQKSSNMRYVGQIGGNGEDGWLVFPLEGDPVAFIFSGGAMLNLWQELQDWVTDVRNAPGQNWSHFIIDHLKKSYMDESRIGIVGLVGYQEAEGTVSYLTMTRLQEGLPEAKFVDATRLIEDLRIYKSGEEIAFIESNAASMSARCTGTCGLCKDI